MIVFGLLLVGLGLYILLDERDSTDQIQVFEQRLKSLRRLSTVNQSYRSVIYMEEKNFWRGNKLVLFSVKYDVIAGVDFSKGISLQKLKDGSFEVSLPPAEVFSSDADESSIEQMLIREGLINNPIRKSDYMPRIVEQGRVNRQSAIDSGILDRAELNAQTAVRRILSLGGIEKVIFERIPVLTDGGIPDAAN